MVFTSRLMYLFVKRVTIPSKVRLKSFAPMLVLIFMGLLCNSASISFSVYLDIFLSGSNKPVLMSRLQPQLSTAYSGNRIAPSFSDLDLSKNLFMSTSSLRPSPLQFGHIPFGSLKPNTLEGPTCGCPMRENIRRRIVLMSVTVPTVEWEPPPIRFWSTTMDMLKFSMASASGWEYFGKKFRTNMLKFSLSRRCDSVAIVSNTMDDFPEPDTPVKMVILRLGMRSETFFKLFSRAPRISIYSWDIVPLVFMRVLG